MEVDPRIVLFVFALLLTSFLYAVPIKADPYPAPPEELPQPGVPKGEIFQFNLNHSKIYPGTKRTITVYVPAEYNPPHPACLFVMLDGIMFNAPTVFDNLIYKKEMPTTIIVAVPPGTVYKQGTNEPIRYNRSFEYDSINSRFADFIESEVLPAVEASKTPDGRVIRISRNPNDHAIGGGSSGGIGAFTAAWERPDLFRRVFCFIGTFVGMRGGDRYPTLVRKTEPKPLRIFLQDGSHDTWNPLFGNWWLNNQSLEASLTFAGYEVHHVWGTGGHDGRQAQAIFPEAVRWLWKGWPAPIQIGRSGNSMLQTILQPGTEWHEVAGEIKRPVCLAVSPSGEVYCVDRSNNSIYRLDEAGDAHLFSQSSVPINALAFGPDARLYAVSAEEGIIFTISPQGKWKVVCRGIHANHLLVTSDGVIYASEAGKHDDMPGSIWKIKGKAKRRVDSGIRHVTGIATSPDRNLFFAAEGHSHWIYSFRLQPDGAFQYKERFYWLQSPESAGDTGFGSNASDIMTDTLGDLYVATDMGIQVCDRNGRVEAILTLPNGEKMTGICFGQPSFDTLYAICGHKIYERKLNVEGWPAWSKPIQLPIGSAA